MPFAMAGTVHAASGASGARHVQLGVTGFPGDPSAFLYACSGANGNFWIYESAAQPFPWGELAIVVRNATGQLIEPKHGQAGCNSCHGTSLLREP